MTSLRLTLISPAVWLSGRLNFALKYWALGLGIALVGAYLSTPLFEHVNREIALAKRQLEGVQVVARQNQIFLQMLVLRTEFSKPGGASAVETEAIVSSAIEEFVRDAESKDQVKLTSILKRNWDRAISVDLDDKMDNRFASFNVAINSMLALSHDSARNYRLNLDPDLDAAFDMMANRLPAIIDTATKQNYVVQWDVDGMAALAGSAQISIIEAMPTLRAGVGQLSAQGDTVYHQRQRKALLETLKLPPDSEPLGHLGDDLELLLSGLVEQQDAIEQVHDTSAAAKRTAKDALNRVAQNNFALGQSLLTKGSAAAQQILQSRIEQLYQDRVQLIVTLTGSGLLIGYLLYAFYIGVLKSVNALSRGTNAFCAGQRDVRIKLKSRDELSLLATNFNTMAQEVETLVQTIEEQNQARERDLKVLVDALGHKNDELSAVNHRVHEELNLARSVQLAILPQQFPDEPTWAVHACMHPARELGGDFYDCFGLPDGRHGVLVADVSGKGVGAAFFMAVSRTVLLDSALSVRTPAQVLALANDLLCARNPMDLFVTACYGLFDPQDGSFEYASAGHHPPLIRRQNGVVETLPTTKDMALGVLNGMQYNEHSTRLLPGDTLLMYTDGVTEAFSPQEIAYGEERLVSWFANRNGQGIAAALVDDLVSDVARFVDGAEASDDLTCLVLCNKRAFEQELESVI